MTKPEESFIVACPIGCRSGLETSEIVLPEGPLKRCMECGQLVSQCSERLYWNSMEEFDDPKGTIPCESSDVKRLVRRTNKIVSKIENLLGKDRREIHLLDVGCSSGAFISFAKNLGVDAEGVEPAAGPARTAQAAGLRVYQGFLEEIQLPEESFDVVTVFEVIEHLKNPTGLVQECHRILRTGGLMVFRTGNTDSWTARYMKGRWEYFHISKHGGHICFYNPTSMESLAKRSGFIIENIRTYGVRFYEKGEISFILYRLAKVFSELLNTPSIWFGKGHELLVYMRKPF